MIVFILSKTNIAFKSILNKNDDNNLNNVLFEISESISERKWNSARYSWAKFIKLQTKTESKIKNKKDENIDKSILFDFLNTEWNIYVKFYNIIQNYSWNYKCTSLTCKFNKFHQASSSFFCLKYFFFFLNLN
jgi:hypothetical protein